MTEYFELFKSAKEAVPENWVGMMIMYFMLKRDIKKAFEKAKPGMLEELSKLFSAQLEIFKRAIDEQVGKLVKAIDGHNADIIEIKKKLASGPNEQSKQTTTQGG